MVRFWIEGIEVYFPYPKIYPEQIAYMKSLKNVLDSKGHAVLEMPTGTGKTVALFSFVSSYQLAKPELGKLVYCTRTIHEMEKALNELSVVISYRNSQLNIDHSSTYEGSNSYKTSNNMNETNQNYIKNINSVKHMKEEKNVKIKVEQDVETPQNDHFLAVGLCSRRNLCIHPEVSSQADRTKIDEKCIFHFHTPVEYYRYLVMPILIFIVKVYIGCDLTSIWRRMQFEDLEDTKRNEHTLEYEGSKPIKIKPSASAVQEIPDIEEFNSMGLCGYYETIERIWNPTFMPSGVYTLEGLKEYCLNFKDPRTGRPSPICPYFAARRAIDDANIVVLNYQYLIDPKVSDAVFYHLCTESYLKEKRDDKDSKPKLPIVVVFDEAHNIDNVCIEALSVELSTETLDNAYSDLSRLENSVRELRLRDEELLLEEYRRLVETTDFGSADIEGYMNPLLRQDIVDRVMPGSIRKAEHFISFLKVVIGYLKKYIKVKEPKSEGPLMFLYRFQNETGIISDVFQHTYNRFKSLLNTLKMTVGNLTALHLVIDFCSLVGTYYKGFIIIVDPFPKSAAYDPVIQFSCLDASVAMKPVLENFQSVILTSGTMSPLEFYPKILNFSPILTQSLPMSLDRECLCPIIVSKGDNQVHMTTKFDLRKDITLLRNYGSLVIELCKSIPDGVVCFFPSYAYMELILSHWYETGILSSIMSHKLVFIETKESISTSLALHNYRRACDAGRGGLFLSVCRGKVAEGIDFDMHYGRCVILIGIPFQYTLSRTLKARLDFMRCNYGILESEFITFDAMRQAAQCIGRVIRNKGDYGLMVLADSRYTRVGKRSKLPVWILKRLDLGNFYLTCESASSIGKAFIRRMSQEYISTKRTKFGQTTLNNEKLYWSTVKSILDL
ncbi:rad3-like DNA helicase-related, putative [Theileria annulata]|uniref:DNA 5'-3' helicase n=1 Tax=Theileria annulata TaxID=5874 RepID=Q4UGA8_THEAN|nr:rad3-like DNA helicase-related, putative [Theileria annulata]CAI73881.1 rad3-like DNA helicase-related, putative [Theileria annulata]|eukprot:XP_954558.1 rad3-like DNA helicase-related, putative [Theileria annulata]